MADGTRKSTREIKLKKEAGFVYDDSLAPLLRRTADVRSASDISEVNSDSDVIHALTSWSVIHNLPTYNFEDTHCDSYSSGSEVFRLSESASPSLGRRNQNVSEFVDISKSAGVSTAVQRLRSSTQGNFLDLRGNFLSAASCSALTDMSESEGERRPSKTCKCNPDEASGCDQCSAPSPNPQQLMDIMMQAINKLDKLSGEVKGLTGRINTLENNSGNESVKKKDGKKSKRSSKKSKVEDERERTHTVVVDKLRSRTGSKEQSDSGEEASDEEEEVDMNGIKKGLSRSQIEERNRKVSATLEYVGATFSEEDPSSSSGTESSGSKSSRRRRRKKVKSGAKVMKRPVKRTELWPHTIANEEDGEEVNSEDITLAKFLSCFTFILAGCEGSELTGRTSLLHAVTTILKYLPWAEARTFHNLVMVKVEQNRISWKSDFVELADNFLRDKGRQNLRSSGASLPSGSSRTSPNYRGGGRSFGNQAGRGYNQQAGRGYYQQSGGGFNQQAGWGYNRQGSNLYSVVCKQWNNGNCTYGARCKKWHTCWSCAEVGKWGEFHKANSHGASGSYRQGEQRF